MRKWSSYQFVWVSAHKSLEVTSLGIAPGALITEDATEKIKPHTLEEMFIPHFPPIIS